MNQLFLKKYTFLCNYGTLWGHILRHLYFKIKLQWPYFETPFAISFKTYIILKEQESFLKL